MNYLVENTGGELKTVVREKLCELVTGIHDALADHLIQNLHP